MEWEDQVVALLRRPRREGVAPPPPPPPLDVIRDTLDEDRWSGIAAEERAYALLVSHLDKEQLSDWLRETSFRVSTPCGRYVWEISGRRGTPSFNVRLVRSDGPSPRTARGDRVTLGWVVCAYPVTRDEDGRPVRNLPLADALLAQKLILEAPGGMEFYLLTPGLQVTLGATL